MPTTAKRHARVMVSEPSLAASNAPRYGEFRIWRGLMLIGWGIGTIGPADTNWRYPTTCADA